MEFQMGQIPPPTPAPPAGAPSPFQSSSSCSMPHLSSTTAPGKIFHSRAELQKHYKSDWHRYNLKRREAGLNMLNEADFQTRLEAAIALRKEREGREERTGVDHWSKKKKIQDNKKDKKNGGGKTKKNSGKGHKRKPTVAKRDGGHVLAEDEAVDSIMEQREENEGDTDKLLNSNILEDVDMEDDDNEDEEEEELPEINPRQSLFDKHISPTMEDNLAYMTKHYSFYLPDMEYLIDLEGLLGYCSEKIRLGRVCLYCQKMFRTWEGCQKHMIDKRHCKILYERGVDQEEFDVFYDFSDANEEFLGTKKKNTISGDAQTGEDDGNDDDDDEWEDVSENDDDDIENADKNHDDDDDDDDDDLYAAYQEEIATHGFDITPLGELIFPDGRIIGHRGLSRYYKQRFAPDRMERAAVRAAKEAAGERLYGGRVVNLYRLTDGKEAGDADRTNENNREGQGTSTALAMTMGRMSGNIPTGRSGKGILVSGGSGGNGGGFTTLSLYRYRAAVKKQRREEARGRRLQHKTQYNTNKMDKKGNNLMTGVVTTLAPR